MDPLSAIVHKSRAVGVGRDLVEKLKNVIPKHMFVIAIQAAVGKNVVARETYSAAFLKLCVWTGLTMVTLELQRCGRMSLHGVTVAT